ncbi:copia protein [Tanacetum coccineum]
MTIIGTKWVFRNKLDENSVVSRNKARLESIRILLVYACALDFKLFQMDVKSAFLNSFINEEVYVAQPPRFIDFEKPDHVYKLKKALYGLKQAPKACVCLCARFQEDPKTTHLEAVKRIFRYIKGRGLSVAELFLGKDATRAIPNMGFNLINVEGVWKWIFKKRNKKKAKSKQNQARNGKDKVKGQPSEENTT